MATTATCGFAAGESYYIRWYCGKKNTNRHNKIGHDGESRSFQFILLQIVETDYQFSCSHTRTQTDAETETQTQKTDLIANQFQTISQSSMAAVIKIRENIWTYNGSSNGSGSTKWNWINDQLIMHGRWAGTIFSTPLCWCGCHCRIWIYINVVRFFAQFAVRYARNMITGRFFNYQYTEWNVFNDLI